MSVKVSIKLEGAKEFADALSRFDREMQTQVQNKMATWAQTVKTEAARLVPVRTGYLRNSIYARSQDWQVQIGAKAAYAAAVEKGTSNRRTRPFIQPAVQKKLPQLERVLREAIEAAKTGAQL
ncbi:MAG: HK97 gp10 family phage protein [Candidatus Bathyarchaeota archaeon]|nr:HK97 gp10 family phage protein [Candidatus Bathyarchaeota archaeon]